MLHVQLYARSSYCTVRSGQVKLMYSQVRSNYCTVSQVQLLYSQARSSCCTVRPGPATVQSGQVQPLYSQARSSYCTVRPDPATVHWSGSRLVRIVMPIKWCNGSAGVWNQFWPSRLDERALCVRSQQCYVKFVRSHGIQNKPTVCCLVEQETIDYSLRFPPNNWTADHGDTVCLRPDYRPD